MVTIPGSSFTFRNPPAHMAIPEATARDAAYETEALLDHLFNPGARETASPSFMGLVSLGPEIGYFFIISCLAVFY